MVRFNLLVVAFVVSSQFEPPPDQLHFLDYLNRERSIRGLRSLVHDEGLQKRAIENNRECRRHETCGHYVLGNFFQVAAQNYYPEEAVFKAWLNSPAHRWVILEPNVTKCGVAWDTAYWTVNFR